MSSDAREAAAAYYAAAGRDPAADMLALGRNPQGLIFCSPQLVALLKPARSGEPARWGILDDCPAGADAWYVHLLVGDLRAARCMARALSPYPWLCFHRGCRNERPHRLPWARLLLPPAAL